MKCKLCGKKTKRKDGFCSDKCYKDHEWIERGGKK